MRLLEGGRADVGQRDGEGLRVDGELEVGYLQRAAGVVLMLLLMGGDLLNLRARLALCVPLHPALLEVTVTVTVVTVMALDPGQDGRALVVVVAAVANRHAPLHVISHL